MAALNWWGSAGGPTSEGASPALGLVNFSPWLGDSQSLSLSTPDALGFNSKAGISYVVTANTTGQGSPNLSVNYGLVVPYTVTPGGTILFTGNGGSVTINGQSGTGFNTDAFTITDAAVKFDANDAFKGATIQFSGAITRAIAAQGTVNTFEVSGWKGPGSLTAPSGSTSTVSASKSAGFVLTDTSLSATDGLNLTLSNINQANLTAATTKNSPLVIVNASAFQGNTALTTTGTGNAVLIGGKGSNTLANQGTGFTLMIAGGGQSTLTGNGRDILVGGTTNYDANTPANVKSLNAILGVWSSGAAYGARVAKLNGTTGTVLNSTTVHNNNKNDQLTDGLSQPVDSNWFLAFSGDQITGKPIETTTIIV
jgi:hypothetical protein